VKRDSIRAIERICCKIYTTGCTKRWC